MSDFYYIAVLTYGKEKHGDRSDFKLGHGAGTSVLLNLLGDRAREVSVPRAHYRYIHLDIKGAYTYQNYLVLRVTPDEKAQVEHICRMQGSSTWVYLWDHTERAWLAFPGRPDEPYHDKKQTGGTCPKFVPTAASILVPSSRNDEAQGEATDKITLTASGDWWWIAGNTYPHRHLLSELGARWSAKRQAWYFKGEALPQAIRDLADEKKDPAPTPALVEPPEQPLMPERVQKEMPAVLALPEPKTDPVQLAVTRLKETRIDTPLTSVVTGAKSSGTCGSISQSYVGELTGSVTGNVQCYGYAIDMGVCMYLNFGGPRMAVEAIRAKLSKGEIVSCIPWDGPSVELTAGEGSLGMYAAYLQNIPEARYTSVILLHRGMVEPLYGGKSRTCLIRTDPAQGVAQLMNHVRKLVTVPVFDTWANFLWEAGTLAHLLVQPIRAGGIDLWAVDLDADAWTRLICTGLKEGVIHLPSMAA